MGYVVTTHHCLKLIRAPDKGVFHFKTQNVSTLYVALTSAILGRIFGHLFLRNFCYSCHVPDISHAEMIGSHMILICMKLRILRLNSACLAESAPIGLVGVMSHPAADWQLGEKDLAETWTVGSFIRVWLSGSAPLHERWEAAPVWQPISFLLIIMNELMMNFNVTALKANFPRFTGKRFDAAVLYGIMNFFYVSFATPHSVFEWFAWKDLCFG